jgi:uncharacterized membrane protein
LTCLNHHLARENSMTFTPLQIATIACAVLAGIGSGMMYVFSTGVMAGLGQLTQAEAVRAMQAINVAVINPLFLGVFMGTGLFAVVVAGISLMGGTGPTNTWLIAGAALYLIGVVVVTVAGNVPLNNALEALDSTALSPAAWADYAEPWLRWNHLRALAGALSSALLIVAATR